MLDNPKNFCLVFQTLNVNFEKPYLTRIISIKLYSRDSIVSQGGGGWEQ